MSSQCHLLIPGLFGPVSNIPDAQTFSILDKLFSRYRITDIPVAGFEPTLFYMLGFQGNYDRLPLAAIVANATLHGQNHKYWLLAEPVHLKADRDRLLLFRHTSMDISSQQAETFCAEISDYFAPDNICCVASSDPMCWILGLDEVLDIKSSWLTDVIGRPIDAYLATGKDASRWRQIMNEIQMLLYQSNVNSQRLMQGLPEVNGVWLSAYGEIPQKTSFQSLPDVIYSDNNIVNSLAFLTDVKIIPPNNEKMVDNNIVKTYTNLQEPLTVEQTNLWLDQLEDCSHWLYQQAQHAWQQNKRVFVYPADGRKIELLKGNIWHHLRSKNRYRQLFL